MENFLKNCGLSHAVGVFEAHRITVEQLEHLICFPDMLKEVLPEVGDRLTIITAVKEMTDKGKENSTPKKTKTETEEKSSRPALTQKMVKNDPQKKQMIVGLLKVDRHVADLYQMATKVLIDLSLFSFDDGIIGCEKSTNWSLIDFAEGTLRCVLCNKGIVLQMRSTFSWNVGNFKRHFLVEHTMSRDCLVNTLLEVQLDDDESPQEDNADPMAKVVSSEVDKSVGFKSVESGPSMIPDIVTSPPFESLVVQNGHFETVKIHDQFDMDTTQEDNADPMAKLVSSEVDKTIGFTCTENGPSMIPDHATLPPFESLVVQNDHFDTVKNHGSGSGDDQFDMDTPQEDNSVPMDIDEFCTNRKSCTNSLHASAVEVKNYSLGPSAEDSITSQKTKEPFGETRCVTKTGVILERSEKLTDDIENDQHADDGPEWRKNGVQFGWAKKGPRSRFYPGFLLLNGEFQRITTSSDVSTVTFPPLEFNHALELKKKYKREITNLRAFNTKNNVSFE